MNDKDKHAELKKLSIETLLVRAIAQHNGASMQEIQDRQFARGQPIPALGLFLYQELKRIYEAQPPGELTTAPLAKAADLEGIDISDDPDMICTLARRCVRDGFLGQNMRDPEDASLYIRMAADNPRVMDELPEKGLAFWKSADFHFRKWKLKNQEKATSA